MSSFTCAYWPSVCVFWKSVYLVFCTFFDQILLLFSCMSCLYILEIKPLLVTSFANIFSQSIGCLFIVFMVSFAVQNLVNLIRSYLFIFLIKKKNCGHTWSLLLWWFFSSCDEQGLLSICGVWTSHWDGFSCCRAWGLACVGSVVPAPGLQSSACGIFWNQEWILCLLHWQVDSLPLSHHIFVYISIALEDWPKKTLV